MTLVQKIVSELDEYIKFVKESETLTQKDKEKMLGDIRRQINSVVLEAQMAIDRIERAEQKEREERVEKKGVRVAF